MEQRVKQVLGYDKVGWLPVDTQARLAPHLRPRLTESSGLAAVRSTAASLRPARRGTEKMASTAVGLAWTTWGLSLALTALGILLLSSNLSYNVHVYDYWFENALIAVASSTVGAVLTSRRPDNLIGWLFCGIGLLNGARLFCAEYVTYASLAAPGSLPGGETLAWICSWTWVINFGLYAFLGLKFPDGRLPTSRWRWVTWLGASVASMGAISVAFSPGPIYGLAPIRNPLGIEGLNNTVSLVELLSLTLVLVAATSLFARMHRAQRVERQQLKWVAYAAAVAVGGLFLQRIIPEVANVWWASWAGFILVVLGIVGIPITMCIAILKYRLYDIDTLINRTLVYGALSTSVIGIYMLIVGGLGTLLQASGHFAISLLATGLIATLFQPLRGRLQCGVNKLMYGERDEPYKVLSRLGRRLEGTLAPEAALTTIVETVSEALKLPYAAIFLKQGSEFVAAAERGTPVGEPVTLPLAHQKELVGQLVVTPRASGEEFTPPDLRLLDDLARQVGVAVHAVRLTIDLQRSRERLVTAREEERRRLRRDLHDGLGPTLAGLTFGLDAARNLLACDPEDAEALLAQLKGQTQEAISDVRRLVYDLRPPALDDLGLVPAIRKQAASHGLLADGTSAKAGREPSREDGLVFSIEAPEHLPTLSAAVEVACYRIAQEAMTNVACHARAHTCRVHLSLDEAKDQALKLEIVDDGVGISGDRRAGVGMSSMRERAAELGGTCVVEPLPASGTRVLARLPLPAQK